MTKKQYRKLLRLQDKLDHAAEKAALRLHVPKAEREEWSATYQGGDYKKFDVHLFGPRLPGEARIQEKDVQVRLKDMLK